MQHMHTSGDDPVIGLEAFKHRHAFSPNGADPHGYLLELVILA
jgi:hypothetical protein